jgi:hypothetical protein
MISSTGYHVPKPVVEPMLLRLAACGEMEQCTFLPKILYKHHKPVLKECVDLLFNLLFKGFLIPIMLFIAGRVFQKTMFPQHLRTNTADVSYVFRVTESCIKLVVLPIRLKEA